MAQRTRVPTTGRSNLNTQRSEVSLSSRPSTVRTISSEERAKWNDTVRVCRPRSPHDPYYQEKEAMPPILPRSIHSTVPLPEEPRLRRTPSCPQTWLEESQKPDVFARSNLNGKLNHEEKVHYCREFIDRNQGELWKYDSEYAKKTPRTLCKELVRDRNFVGIMTKHHHQESVMRLSNSDSTRDCLQFDNTSQDRFDPAFRDPFMSSITTARRIRDERVQNMFAPALSHTDKRFNRGHEHAPEFGNFSRYNGVIKSNAAAVIKR